MRSGPSGKVLGVFIITIVVAAIAALTIFIRNTGDKEVMSISIGTIPYEKNALIYIAESQGFFAENGLNLAVKDYETGVAAAEAMMAGKVDVAVASEFVVVGRAFKDYRFKIFASIAKTQDDYIIGRTDRGIRAVSDLRGKKVGVRKETAAEFYLGRFLDRQGLSIDDVELVDVNPGRSVETFAQGEFDAIVIWQPYSYRIQKLLKDKIVTWSAQNDQLMYWNLLATDSWLAGHSEAVRRLLRSLAQAERYLMLHPQEAKSIVQKRLRYDDESMTAIWPDTQFVMSLDQSLVVAMEDEARWMISNRRTRSNKVPDFFNHIYLNGLVSERPEVVTIIR